MAKIYFRPNVDVKAMHSFDRIGHLIGTVLWLLGILLAVKEFFPKKA